MQLTLMVDSFVETCAPWRALVDFKARNHASKRQAILKPTLRNNLEPSLRRSNCLLPILDSRTSSRMVQSTVWRSHVSQKRYSLTTKRSPVSVWIISMRQISPSKRRNQPVQHPEGWIVHLREIVQGRRDKAWLGSWHASPGKFHAVDVRLVTSISETLFTY